MKMTAESRAAFDTIRRIHGGPVQDKTGLAPPAARHPTMAAGLGKRFGTEALGKMRTGGSVVPGKPEGSPSTGSPLLRMRGPSVREMHEKVRAPKIVEGM